MKGLTADAVSVFDDLEALVLGMSPEQLRRFAAGLDPDDLALLEQVVARVSDSGWRADPAGLAERLTGGAVKRWRYVALLSQAFVRAVEGESIRQVWMLPARYGKTNIASRWGPVWALDRYPSLRVILTSYGADLAAENSGTVRDLIEAHQSRLSVKVRRDRSARDEWYTTEGGMVKAAGVGGAMTGYGGDVIVVDDPFKNWQEAHSAARREHVWNWYRSVVRLRLNTEDSALIVVGTRWHQDDLVGRLLDPPDGEEPEPWEVIRLPAIAEEPDPLSPNEWEHLPDPLGREAGEVLEPERFSEAAVKARARVLGSYLTAAMEQQRPSSAEGGILKRAWWNYYDARPSALADYLVSWDASFKDADGSSFCVGQVWARSGSLYYLVDQVRDRMDYPTFKRAVESLSAKWPEARVVLIEDKANGPAVIADLRGKLGGIIPVSPEGSKESRAHAVSGVIEAGDVFLPDPQFSDERVDRSFVAGFVEECADFPNASNDDQVDAMTQALNRYMNAPPPVKTPAPGGARQGSQWRP